MCLQVLTPSICLRELKKKKTKEVAAGVFPGKAKWSRWVCDWSRVLQWELAARAPWALPRLRGRDELAHTASKRDGALFHK